MLEKNHSIIKSNGKSSAKGNHFTEEIFPAHWINTVQNLDCVEGMNKLPSKSVDLIIADPPYNLSKGNNWKWDRSVDLPGFGGAWNKVMEKWDKMPLIDYLNFTNSWVTAANRVLKPTGSIWVFGTYHNIGIINFMFQLLEIEIINEVIWYKRNAFPNLSGRRLTASHETLLWAHNGGKKRTYFFNYEEAKNGLFSKDNLKKEGKQMRTVWDIPNNKSRTEIKFGKHPTQKPLSIITRIIRLTSRKDDLCLFPFAGAGSDCVAAKMLGRKFLAFETDEEYLNITLKRLAQLEHKQASMGEFL